MWVRACAEASRVLGISKAQWKRRIGLNSLDVVSILCICKQVFWAAVCARCGSPLTESASCKGHRYDPGIQMADQFWSCTKGSRDVARAYRGRCGCTCRFTIRTECVVAHLYRMAYTQGVSRINALKWKGEIIIEIFVIYIFGHRCGEVCQRLTFLSFSQCYCCS